MLQMAHKKADVRGAQVCGTGTDCILAINVGAAERDIEDEFKPAIVVTFSAIAFSVTGGVPRSNSATESATQRWGCWESS
jgi:hypothetical protein